MNQPALRVIKPGVCTTVQDLGRPGYQDMAIPVSGVRDPDALRLGNALVNNTPGCAGLEISLQGPTLEVLADAVRVVLTGTVGRLHIIEPENYYIAAWQSVTLPQGTIFKVAPFSETFGAVLAVEGGFDLPEVMGSHSTFMLGQLGGFEGRALKAGDILPLKLDRPAPTTEKLLHRPIPKYKDHSIRVVLGPQDDYFSSAAITTFFNSPYQISSSSDRMGLRLEGPELKHNDKGFNIASDGIATGAIQVPGNGQPIILFNDHQVTGGYAKIGTVISIDLGRLGRILPGEEIYFTEISVAEAEDLYRQHEQHLQEMIASMHSFSNHEEALNLKLKALNLIDGLHPFPD